MSQTRAPCVGSSITAANTSGLNEIPTTSNDASCLKRPYSLFSGFHFLLICFISQLLLSSLFLQFPILQSLHFLIPGKSSLER
jgi:hypothetical protein